MSRSRSRACQRRRRLEAGLREAVKRARTSDAAGANTPTETRENGALWKLLRDIERSNLCVWDVARAIQCTEDELAMIAQIVAPHLAAMTPGSVYDRQQKLAS